MSWFGILILLFIIVSAAMILIILVQRPSGGGLAGAFGGAGGTGSDTVFGGRVGDALTWATTIAFIVYLLLAIGLNLTDVRKPTVSATPTELVTDPAEQGTGAETTPPAGEQGAPVTSMPTPTPAPATTPTPGTDGD